MKTTNEVIAYKAFNSDMTCRDHQYEVGQTYEVSGKIEICENGYHACTVPFDCWRYYERSATFARVRLGGDMDRDGHDSKIAAARITIEANLLMPDWINAQAHTVIDLCRSAVGMLAGGERENAAATGYRGHAAATGYRGHAAATGDSGHAAATGNSGHAAATGDSGHAAATGDSGHAAATGNSGHAAATGYRGHAAATGDSGHAAATGYRGHAAATGYRGHAAVEGKNAIAASLGYEGTATAHEGGWIVLSRWSDDGCDLIEVRTAQVGAHGVEAGKRYRLTETGFTEIEA